MSNYEEKERQGGGGYVNNCRKTPLKKRPTRLTISTETVKVCDYLRESVGLVAQQKIKSDKETEIFHHRRCLFVRTEQNYQRYRNLDMFTSIDLAVFSDTIKNNVGVYGKGFKDLNETLKGIAKGIKDLKTKVQELRDAGCRLEDCVRDDCNKTQRRALTGNAPGCNEQTAGCADSENILKELVHYPKGLLQDADILFKSAYEVVGIQTFSNVESLDGLQKKLDDHAKKFTKQITEVTKTREGDLKKLQEDMVKSSQEVEKAYLDLNHNRSVYEGYRDAAEFLCEQPCGCGKTDNEKEDYERKREPRNNDKVEDVYCRPILKDCHTDICEICKVVDNTLCCEAEAAPPPAVQPTKPQTGEC